MRLIAAHTWHEQVVQHGQIVDAQVAPPIVVTVEQAGKLPLGGNGGNEKRSRTAIMSTTLRNSLAGMPL
jgi:hypothetical protein